MCDVIDFYYYSNFRKGESHHEIGMEVFLKHTHQLNRPLHGIGSYDYLYSSGNCMVTIVVAIVTVVTIYGYYTIVVAMWLLTLQSS